MAGKIFKYLPKSTSFSITTSSSNNVHRASFSGPIVSIIPKEARRTKRSDDSGFESQEPTSPKVSCIGQVKKHKKKHEKKKKEKKKEEEVESKKSGIWGMFQKKVRHGRPPVAEATTEKVPMMMRRCTSGREVAPEVGMMKKFASGRETLADFDWRKFAIGEKEVIVAHSAPLVMGGGGGGEVEQKKEVNLWKRRTSAPPRPLQLKQA